MGVHLPLAANLTLVTLIAKIGKKPLPAKGAAFESVLAEVVL